MTPVNHLNPWTKLEQRAVYENPWISLTEHQVVNPAGGSGIYGVVHFKNLAIGILPLDDEGQLTLVGQFRFPLDQYSWEIPEGGCPLGTEPLESAQRELLEETGLRASSWKELMHLHLSNSVSDEGAKVYLATGLSQHEASPEETEDLRLRKVSLDAACQMIYEGEITDALSVCAILRLRLLLNQSALT